MKKIIVAAAGLMLAGTMASTAVADAGVNFTGDARARFYFQDNYTLTDSKDTHWTSRVRLQMRGETAGGAYAVGRFRLADATWDGTQQTDDRGEGTNIRVDKAYLGVPFGPVTIEAGMMDRNVTKFLEWDTRVDAIQAIYAGESTTVIALMEKVDEVDETTETVTVTGTTAAGLPVALSTPIVTATEAADEDDDIDRYGIVLTQQFEGGWALTATGLYVNNDQGDTDGFIGDLKVDGAMGDIAVGAEFAFIESDLVGGDDDAMGGYAVATVPMGAASLTGIVGFTADGYVADGDFGPFIMLSDVGIIASGINIGALGDTFFAGVVPSFQASENLTISGIVAYADIDDIDTTVIEVGAKASYAVTDGASLNAEIGYLDVEDADENPFGFGLELAVKF